ncbi:MAG: protein-export chaperone SecB, partial [Pseudomonadales bacterium]|nr:protein-export chaperone SecB [Pseudomonadales bacterium]
MSEQENNPETKFGLQRIYVKDFSFESPKAPQSFREEWKPKINMELNTRHAKIDDEHFEVTLVLTVTAKNESDDVLYLIEIQQAGIFMMAGMTEEVLARTLGSYCPGVLFPYARDN